MTDTTNWQRIDPPPMYVCTYRVRDRRVLAEVKYSGNRWHWSVDVFREHKRGNDRIDGWWGDTRTPEDSQAAALEWIAQNVKEGKK